MENKIPKIIWMFWAQGYDQAPYVVKKCYESWKKYNSDWEIRFLDDIKVHNFLPDLSKICEKNAPFIESRKALYSDIIRLNLLKEYGGVWADATCFCCMPLDQWIHKYTHQDFFAFNNEHKDRMLSNWFLISSQDSYIMQKWCEGMNNYFQKNTYKCYWHEFYQYEYGLLTTKKNKVPKMAFLKVKNKLREKLFKLTKKHGLLSVGLIVDPIRKIKYVPYFCCHYHFSKIVFFDNKCREIWKNTPRFSARIPTILSSSKLIEIPMSSQTQEHIDERKSPLYKLTYKIENKIEHIDKIEGSPLHYLTNFHGVG